MPARQFKLTGPSSYSSRLVGSVALKRGETIRIDDGPNAEHIAALTQVVGDREEAMFTEVGTGLGPATFDLTAKVPGAAASVAPPTTPEVVTPPVVAVTAKVAPQRSRRVTPA